MARVRFECYAPEAKQVFLAGDFNDWKPAVRRMQCRDRAKGLFVAAMELKPGRYEYKYVVDGAWRCCPKAEQTTNEHGTHNSVMTVTEDGAE